MISKIKLAYVLITTSIGMYFAFEYFNFTGYHAMENIDCQSYFKLSSSSYTLPLVSRFQVINGKSVLTLEGIIYKGSVKVGVISRRLSFNFSKDHFSSKMLLKKVTKYEKDSVDGTIEAEIIPSAFLKEGSVFYLKTITTENGLIFMREETPMFFCKFQ